MANALLPHGAGIIKNTEMYLLYYRHQVMKDISMPKDGLDMILNLIMLDIILLYQKGYLKSKDVLHLLAWADKCIERNKADAENGGIPDDLLTFRYEINEIVGRQSLEFMKQEVLAWENAFEDKTFKQIFTPKERSAARKSFRKFHKMTKHGNADIIEEILAKNTVLAVKDLMKKYAVDEDLRVPKSPYEDVLAPYFDNPNHTEIIGTVLEEPEIAKVAYSFALNSLDQISAEEMSGHENAEHLQGLRQKYRLLKQIAENDAEPDVLAKCLKEAAEGSA